MQYCQISARELNCLASLNPSASSCLPIVLPEPPISASEHMGFELAVSAERCMCKACFEVLGMQVGCECLIASTVCTRLRSLLSACMRHLCEGVFGATSQRPSCWPAGQFSERPAWADQAHTGQCERGRCDVCNMRVVWCVGSRGGLVSMVSHTCVGFWPRGFGHSLAWQGDCCADESCRQAVKGTSYGMKGQKLP